MGVPFDYYRIFYHVAKYRSFTRAAKILMSSQPNVTRAIGRLEDELGCRLFVRSNKGVAFTQEGERLYGHVQVAYEHLLRGENEIREGRSLLHGHVSIAVSESALHGLLLPVLRTFHQAYPNIRIQLTNSTTPQAIEAVRRGTAEAALVTTPAEAGLPLHQERLKGFRDVLIAGPAFAGEKERSVSLRDIAQRPLVSLAQGTSTWAYYSRLFCERGLSWAPEIEVATAAQVLPVVKHDLGLGFVPSFMAREAIERGDVFQLTLSEALPERHISLIWDRSHPQSPAVEELIRMLKQQADGSASCIDASRNACYHNP